MERRGYREKRKGMKRVSMVSVVLLTPILLYAQNIPNQPILTDLTPIIPQRTPMVDSLDLPDGADCPPPPPEIIDISIDESQEQVVFRWQELSCAEAYQVYITDLDDDDYSTGFCMIGNASSLTRDIESFRPGDEYEIEIGAFQFGCPTVIVGDLSEPVAFKVYDDCLGAGYPCVDQDSDGDGWYNLEDNCPETPNPGQADQNGDGIGDACSDLCEERDFSDQEIDYLDTEALDAGLLEFVSMIQKTVEGLETLIFENTLACDLNLAELMDLMQQIASGEEDLPSLFFLLDCTQRLFELVREGDAVVDHSQEIKETLNAIGVEVDPLLAEISSMEEKLRSDETRSPQFYVDFLCQFVATFDQFSLLLQSLGYDPDGTDVAQQLRDLTDLLETYTRPGNETTNALINSIITVYNLYATILYDLGFGVSETLNSLNTFVSCIVASLGGERPEDDPQCIENFLRDLSCVLNSLIDEPCPDRAPPPRS